MLKNPHELVARLGFDRAERALLVDAPEELAALVRNARGPDRTTLEATSETLRSVRDAFDGVLVWRENRAGSRSLFASAVRRMAPDGYLWIVTALKKVRGPSTPAVHRLELSDLVKAFAADGLAYDREVRVSAWHAAYRFTPRTERTSPSPGKTSPSSGPP